MSYRAIVVGGGISGLAAAHRLLELGRERSLPVEITLLEASRRLGGAIGTERKDGFLIEAGPDSLISEKPWGIRLCERLGLTSSLRSVQPILQSLYVVHDGSLVPLPEGFILMAPTRLFSMIRTGLFSWPGKLRMAMDLDAESGDTHKALADLVRRNELSIREISLIENRILADLESRAGKE